MTIGVKETKFSEETLQKVAEIVARYPQGKQKSALLPVLHLAQAELGGWMSVPAMDYVASLLDIKPIEVYEVASFYTMFHLKPVGKYVLEVCRTGPCSMCGGDELVAHLEQTLGIKEGETTPDGLFTLKTVECLAACGTAPVLQIGPEYTYHEQLTPAKADALIASLREQSKTSSSL